VPPPDGSDAQVSRPGSVPESSIWDGGNLICIGLTEAQRRAELEEKSGRPGPGGKRGRAARERLERERAEQLARKRPPGSSGLPRRSGRRWSAAGWEAEARARPRKSASVRRGRRQKPVPASLPSRKRVRQRA